MHVASCGTHVHVRDIRVWCAPAAWSEPEKSSLRGDYVQESVCRFNGRTCCSRAIAIARGNRNHIEIQLPLLFATCYSLLAAGLLIYGYLTPPFMFFVTIVIMWVITNLPFIPPSPILPIPCCDSCVRYRDGVRSNGVGYVPWDSPKQTMYETRFRLNWEHFPHCSNALRPPSD